MDELIITLAEILKEINAERKVISDNMLQIDDLIIDIRKRMSDIDTKYNRMYVEILKLK
jgi:hypothetical protein